VKQQSGLLPGRAGQPGNSYGHYRQRRKRDHQFRLDHHGERLCRGVAAPKYR